MARRVEISPADAARLDLVFFSPCSVCDRQNRAALVRMGVCPAACDHMRAVQRRLRRIRTEFTNQERTA
jgi:hypothetical protein